MRLQGTYAERTLKPPKRTIVEQASKNVQYVSAEFFRSSEARLSSPRYLSIQTRGCLRNEAFAWDLHQ